MLIGSYAYPRDANAIAADGGALVGGGGRPHDAVPPHLDLAGGVAAVAEGLVAVVALFEARAEAVAARGRALVARVPGAGLSVQYFSHTHTHTHTYIYIYIYIYT